MADIVTGTVTGQVDETALLEQFAATRQEVAEDTCATIDAVKTAGWANSDRTGTEADRLSNQMTQYFIAGEASRTNNTAALQAALAALAVSEARDAAAGIAASVDAGNKAVSAATLAQAITGQQIVADGNATRALINELKMDQLNRELIERNAALVECRHEGRHYQSQFNNSQYSNLVSQVNALNSQMTETRQGMVNFGTMAGVGQSSTSNNVR